MPAQEFGDQLRQYINGCSLTALASCVYWFPLFSPAGLRNSAELARLLPGIMAGDPWPFDPHDLVTFVEALIHCVPRRHIRTEFALRESAALYFGTL